MFKQFDLVLLGFLGEHGQHVAEEISADLFRDDQVIFHLLLGRVVSDAAVFGGAVIREGVCGKFIGFLRQVNQLVV